MSNNNTMLSKLKEVVGEDHVIHDPDKLKDYALDGKVPRAVVSPGTIEEASKTVAYANEQRLGVIPRGNGSKMGIGGIPEKADLVLSTRTWIHLSRIRPRWGALWPPIPAGPGD